jgi:hypothetical protein
MSFLMKYGWQLITGQNVQDYPPLRIACFSGLAIREKEANRREKRVKI